MNKMVRSQHPISFHLSLENVALLTIPPQNPQIKMKNDRFKVGYLYGTSMIYQIIISLASLLSHPGKKEEAQNQYTCNMRREISVKGLSESAGIFEFPL